MGLAGNSTRNGRFTVGSSVELHYNPYLTLISGDINLSPYIWNDRQYLTVSTTETVSSIVDGSYFGTSQFGGTIFSPKGKVNYVPHSNKFNYVWAATGATLTTLLSGSPNGLAQRAEIKEDSNTSEHYIYAANPTGNITKGRMYTVSCFVKSSDRRIKIKPSGLAFTLGTNAVFNPASGEFESLNGNIYSYGKEYYGSGWWRVWFTLTADVTDKGGLKLSLYNSADSYAGNGTSNVSVWGAQLIEGFEPTYPEDNETAGSYTMLLSAVLEVSLDCFNRSINSYTNKSKDAIYIFTNQVGKSTPYNPSALGATRRTLSFPNVIYNNTITKKDIKITTNKYSEFSLNYKSFDEYNVNVLLGDIAFDTVAQLLMSRAVLMVSCDTVYTEDDYSPESSEDFSIAGGGSFNPMSRLCYTTDTPNINSRDSIELNFKLIG